MPGSDARARYAPDAPSQSQAATPIAVVDLRAGGTACSSLASSSSSDESESESGGATRSTVVQVDPNREGQSGGDGYESINYQESNQEGGGRADGGTQARSYRSSKSALNGSKAGGRPPKLRQRFGPDEDYILAVQVNADELYAVQHGDIRRRWDELAAKLNGSPNFNMVAIKGVTAQARFKRILDKHRSWERSSAQKSGTDEQETPYIEIMTELMSKVNDFEAAQAKKAAAAAEQEQAKVNSGEVVRQAAVSRIKLGKRNARSDESDEEEKENNSKQRNKKGSTDWVGLLAEVKEQRSQFMESIVKIQEAGLQQRLAFEREERKKDRIEREREREERRMEREERQKEREMQAKLFESLTQRLTKTRD